MTIRTRLPRPYNPALDAHLTKLGYVHHHYNPSYDNDWRNPAPFYGMDRYDSDDETILVSQFGTVYRQPPEHLACHSRQPRI